MSGTERYPRVLIVSHNAFSMTNNMGKTLVSYFSSFPKSCLAQLYLHEGVPHSNICSNYYSFSDKDALKSVIIRSRKGTVYQDQTFDEAASSVITGKLYTAGKTKNPVVSFARDIVWKLSNWKNKSLINWVREFNPDLIFFASGDYVFADKIAMRLSELFDVPLATCCFDDFYSYCSYKKRFLGGSYYRKFMKAATETIKRSKWLFVVNDLMAEEYSKMFGKDCTILYTSAGINTDVTGYSGKQKNICYIGGLALNRQVPVCEIGRLLKGKIEGLPDHVDVYSAENREEVLQVLTMENGIDYHGPIAPAEVQEKIKNSLAVIHVESFDENNRQRTRLSLSTKIAESLSSGTVLIAYGPLELASMQYLIKNDVAIVSDDLNDLKKKMEDILNDERKYTAIVNRAIELAKKNHGKDTAAGKLLQAFADTGDA